MYKNILAFSKYRKLFYGYLAVILSVITAWVFFNHMIDLPFAELSDRIANIRLLVNWVFVLFAILVSLIFFIWIKFIKAQVFTSQQSYALDQSCIVAATDLLGTITYANDKFEQISGYSRSELIGQDHRLLNSNFHTKDFFMELWATILSGNIWHGILKNKKKDGSYYWLDSTIVPIKNEFGEINQFISIRYDISDIKRTQEQLIKSKEDTLTAMKSRSAFFANVSHEIRTPMNAVIGMAELLNNTQLSTEQKRYVDIFKSAGENLLQIINDILDFSKLETGTFEIQHKEFNVIELIEEVSSIFLQKIVQKKLNFECRIHPDIDGRFIGDAFRIKQVLINLVSNAIKFTDKGKIRIEVLLNTSLSQKGNLIFTITDSGTGIKIADHDQVFKPFFQAKQQSGKVYGGTGLGLGICKQFVDLMGGQIWFESEVGVGSIFSFTVNCVPSLVCDPESKWRNNKILAQLKSKTILIIDESPFYKSVVSELLQTFGAEIFAYDNCEDGLAALVKLTADHKIVDYIFLDSKLKADSGYIAFARSVKDNMGLLNIRIFLMCLGFLSIPEDELLKYGIQAVLYKPISRKALVEIVRSSLIQQKSISLDRPSIEILNPRITPLNILVVDDSIDNRLILKAYLKNTNFNVIEAENGAIAVEKATHQHFDVIFMDMQMPVMDGCEATKAIRLWELEHHAPISVIVALTAFAQESEKAHCMEAGCNVHIAKPIRKQLLLDTLNSVRLLHG
jgi:PAS domain S-box-containing protein